MSDNGDDVQQEVAQEEPKHGKKRKADEQSAPEGAQEGDMPLTCRDCTETFLHTVADQEFFASKGFEQLPVRCAPCRKAKKQAMDGGAGGGRGGFGGDRGAPRAGGNACFNCGKEGHMSRECTEARKERAPGGGACFNCGKEGHKSFDCPNGGGGGGGRGGRGGFGGGRGGGGGYGGGRGGSGGYGGGGRGRY